MSDESGEDNQQNVLVNEDVPRQSVPWYSKLIVDHPCLVICLEIVMVVVVVYLDTLVFDLTTNTDHGWAVRDDKKTHRSDALMLAREYVLEEASASSTALPKTQDIPEFGIDIYFKQKSNRNIINSDNIKFIVGVERLITETDPEEYFRLCLAEVDSHPNCSQSKAVLSVFQDLLLYANVSSDSDADISQQAIDEFMAANLNRTTGFRKAFILGFDGQYSNYYRANFKFGLPYPDISSNESSWKDRTDDFETQQEHYDELFFPDVYDRIQIDINEGEASDRDLEIVIGAWRLINLKIEELIIGAMVWIFGSIVAVFVLLSLHLRSLFLAATAMLQICCSFPLAYFIYYFVFGVTFFDTLSLLVFFVVLGIGADDVFVFSDAFAQSVVFIKDPSNLYSRITFTYHRAAPAMLVTQLTTFFAFIANYFSPLMPVAAFGIWAASVIASNYFFVVTLYPACVVIWHRYVKRMEKRAMSFVLCSFLWQTPGKTGKDDPKSSEENTKDESSEQEEAANIGNAMQEEKSEKEELNESIKRGRAVERFLGGVWSELMIKWRYILFTIGCVVFGLAIYTALQIEGLEKQEEFLDQDHYVSKAQRWPTRFFGGAEIILVRINLLWGVQERVDKSGISIWEGEELGTIKWDNGFDMSSTESQKFLLGVCSNITELYADEMSSEDSLNCFMDDLVDFGLERGLSFPFVFDASNASAQREQFTDFIAEFAFNDSRGNLRRVNGELGYVDTEHALKFVSINWRLNRKVWISPSEKSSLFDKWEDRMDRWNAQAASNTNTTRLSRGFQTADRAYMDGKTAEAFVSSALQGLMIAFPLAWLVLFLSTRNYLVASYAAIIIAAIVASEVAIMHLQGLQLGVIQSLGIVMMVGFAVDYTVHLGISFVECDYTERNLKIKYALFSIGVSVVFGALTSAASGMFLFFTGLLVFSKFAVFFTTVVGFSIVYSLTFFIAILAIFGPVGQRGHLDLIGLLTATFSYIFKRTKLYFNNTLSDKA